MTPLYTALRFTVGFVIAMVLLVAAMIAYCKEMTLKERVSFGILLFVVAVVVGIIGAALHDLWERLR